MKNGHKDVSAAGFSPRCEAEENHGIYVYINSEITEEMLQFFLKRYHKIEKLTRNPKEFALWLIHLKKDVGLVEWKPFNKNHDQIPRKLAEVEDKYQYSYDSGGTCFLTPKGVTKATTFQELLETRYKDITKANISIAGDSLSTDGSLFTIPEITHIAVTEKKLLQEVTGKNIFVETPQEANEILKEIMKKKFNS